MENNKNTKIALSIVIMLIIIITSVVATAVVYKLLVEFKKETVNNNGIVVDDTNTDTEKIVDEISYIEIQVDNSGEEGLSMTDPLKIENQETIEEIKNIINRSEWFPNTSESGTFEGCPMVTIYQENGESLYVIACDNFEMDEETIGAMISISKNEDLSDKEFYKVDKELGAYIQTLYDDNINSTKIGDYFIIYNGVEIEKKTGVQQISDMKITDEANKKYNTTYHNYENGKYLGTSEGIFGEETYEGYSLVTTSKRIAISEKYDAIPREYETIEELPKELIDMADYTSVDIQAIDLDGDGKTEYIVCWTVNYAEGEIGDDGEPQASSGIILFDNNYKKIVDLVTLENGFLGNNNEEDDKRFLSLDKVEYIDIDNDGIMEVIIEVPQYEGAEISIVKYKDGAIEGETDIKASVEA